MWVEATLGAVLGEYAVGRVGVASGPGHKWGRKGGPCPWACVRHWWAPSPDSGLLRPGPAPGKLSPSASKIKSRQEIPLGAERERDD